MAALETVLQDDAQLLHRPEDQLRRSLEEMRLLGVDRIRVTAGWSVLTRDADSEIRPPRFDGTNPAAYEQDRWRNLDRLVILAREYGFKTMIDIAFWAPRWASTDTGAERGRTNVDSEAFKEFSVAVARRYSGSYIVPRAAVAQSSGPIKPTRDQEFLASGFGTTNPPDGGMSMHAVLGASWLNPPTTLQDALPTAGRAATVPLPKVDVFTLWNEPNHTSFLRPQWERVGKRWIPRSPHIYREMVAKTYPAIKALRPDSTILIGATSYAGSYADRGTGNVAPLHFLRELACVDEELEPIKRGGCASFQTVPGDGWSHHPYSLRTEPDARTLTSRPDDLPIAETPRLAATLEALIARGRLSGGARNIWITEYGYETNPPLTDHIYTPGDQARFLPWAEYIAQRVPTVKTFAQFLLRDLPPSAFRVGNSKKRPFGQWQSGILTEKGEPKLGMYAFRAGLYVQLLGGKRLRFWGRLRLGGGVRTVAIDRRRVRGGQWQVLSTTAPGQAGAPVTFTADGRGAFQRFGKAPDGSGFRYRLRYLDGDRWITLPQVAPVER